MLKVSKNHVTVILQLRHFHLCVSEARTPCSYLPEVSVYAVYGRSKLNLEGRAGRSVIVKSRHAKTRQKIYIELETWRPHALRVSPTSFGPARLPVGSGGRPCGPESVSAVPRSRRRSDVCLARCNPRTANQRRSPNFFQVLACQLRPQNWFTHLLPSL